MIATPCARFLLFVLLVFLASAAAADERPGRGSRTVSRLVSGLEGGSGSTIGPDGAIYVTEGAAGRVSRVNPKTGRVTTFATGLPKSIVGIGGAMDVAFLGKTAYVLVTLVGPDVGGTDIVGIYRVDGRNRFTMIANIGAFAIANPPTTQFFVPSGVQYAMQPYRDGFLVSDGHHNRVYYVTREGQVSVLIAFGNIVPTGLALVGSVVLMAEAGPVPHLPEDGKIVAFGPKAEGSIEVAAGARLLVDVEVGRGHKIYGLAQGIFPEGNPDGSPAAPHTGSLVRVKSDGTFAVLVRELNQPTSLELIGNTAYVVTLGGEIWRIRNVH